MILCKQLKIIGFRSVHDELTLDFLPGSFVVEGNNGAGKSTVIEEALWWLLTGTSLRGEYIKNVINRDSALAQVTGTFELPGIGAATMVRSRDLKNTKGFTFTSAAGVDLLAGAGTTQAAFKSPVENIFGMSLSTIRATSFYAPSRGFLALGDTARRTLIEGVLNLTWLEQAAARSKKEHKETKEKLTQLQLTYTAAQTEATTQEQGALTLRQQAKLLKDADTQISQDEIEKAQQALTAAQTNHQQAQAAHQAAQKEVEAANALLQPLYNKRTEIAGQVRQLEQGQARIQASKAAATREVDKAKQKAQGIVLGAQCPTCIRPFTENDVAAAQQVVQAEVDTATKLHASLEENAKVLGAGLAELKAVNGPAQQLQNQITEKEAGLTEKTGKATEYFNAAEIAFFQVNSATSTLNALQQQASASGSQDTKYAKLVEAAEAAETNAANSKQRAAKLLSELSTLEQEVQHLAWWKTAFSAKGMRAYILEGALPGIANAASYYLGLMFNHTMALELHPTKVNDDGKVSETLNLVVKNVMGIDTASDLSTGEQRAVDIALTLALSDLAIANGGRGLGFMALDEALDALDENHAKAVSTVLGMLGQTKGMTTGVVAHSKAVQTHFARVLHVERGKDSWTTATFLDANAI